MYLPGCKVLRDENKIKNGFMPQEDDRVIRIKIYFIWNRLEQKSVCSVVQSCLTLCDATDGSLPGSSVHEISQAKVLERVAISFSGAPSPTALNCVIIVIIDLAILFYIFILKNAIFLLAWFPTVKINLYHLQRSLPPRGYVIQV